jgi:FAD:protein FMN transferase
MICVKRSPRKQKASSLLGITICIITIALLSLARPSFAQGGIKQFQRQFALGGRHRGAILLVGWNKDAAAINRLMDTIIARANESYIRLDCQNPSSIISQMNARSGGKEAKVVVPTDVLSAFQAAKKVSSWTGGAFDITYLGTGSYKNIKIRNGSSTVELKKSGMRVCFTPIIEGLMADFILHSLHASNMTNTIVKVGYVFRGAGQSVSGPWKIQVQDDAGTYAHHALNLIVKNSGVSTVSASQYRAKPLIDPRTKAQIAIPCRGTTVVMQEAALAQGLAQAVFVLGPQKGFELLSSKARGLIVSNSGQFLRTPGF